MCDFTPRRPKELPTSQWAPLEQLLNQLEPYAPEVCYRLGPQKLRQLITEWYKDHPAFAGLPSSEWANLLKEVQGEFQDFMTFKVCSPCGPRRTTLRYPRTFAPYALPQFCFEHTPVVLNEEQMHEKFASLYAAHPRLAQIEGWHLDMPKFNQEIWTMWDAREHPEEYYPARVIDMAYVQGAFEYKIERLTNDDGSFVDEDETKHADSTVLDRKMSDWSYSKPCTGGVREWRCGPRPELMPELVRVGGAVPWRDGEDEEISGYLFPVAKRCS